MATSNQQEAQNTFSREVVITRRRPVLSGAQTLTVDQSGALCIWNSATGYTFTLPAITGTDIGVWFDFAVTVTNTATADKIICAVGDFLIGMPLTYVANTTPAANPGPKGFAYDGTTHLACTMGGSDTTAGGVAGTFLRLTAINVTQWLIEGNIAAAGTIVTAAATS